MIIKYDLGRILIDGKELSSVELVGILLDQHREIDYLRGILHDLDNGKRKRSYGLDKSEPCPCCEIIFSE